MTKMQMMNQRRSRLVLVSGLAVLWGIAGCGEVEGQGGPAEEDAPIVSGRVAGGVGVVRLTISDLKPVNGKVKTAVCSGTVISSNRVITAGHCFDTWLTIKANGGTTALLQGDLFAAADYTEDGTNWICLNDFQNAPCGLDLMGPIHVSRMGISSLPPDIAVARFTTALQGINSTHFRELSTGDVHVKQSVEEWGAGVTDPAATTPTQMTKSVVKVTAFNATTITISNSVAQTCLGDSGGPIFAGASDLAVGVVSQIQQARNRNCAVSTGPTVTARITPAVIDFINTNRAGGDPVCYETIAGTGFQACF